MRASAYDQAPCNPKPRMRSGVPFLNLAGETFSRITDRQHFNTCPITDYTTLLCCGSKKLEYGCCWGGLQKTTECCLARRTKSLRENRGLKAYRGLQSAIILRRSDAVG